MIPELPYILDQATNLVTGKFLAKGGHATFAITHNRNQSARAGDIRMLSPPIRIGEIGCVVRVAQRRIAGAVSSVATRTVIPEQISDGGFGYSSSLRRRSPGNR